MADVDRNELIKDVHRRLADHRFASRMKARAEDGTKPIVVALATDHFSDLLHRVTVVGGLANVVASVLDGMVVFGMKVEPLDGLPTELTSGQLDPDCTVGVLVARMIADGGGTREYACPSPDLGGNTDRATTTDGSLVGL